MVIKRRTALRDTLAGTSDADRIFGYAGNDSLYGKGSDDILYCGVAMTGPLAVRVDRIFGELG